MRILKDLMHGEDEISKNYSLMKVALGIIISAAVIAGTIGYLAAIARYSMFFGGNRDNNRAGMIKLVKYLG